MMKIFLKALKSTFLSEDEQMKEVLERQSSLQKENIYIMSSLTNLQEAITRLSSITDEAVKVLNTPHPTEEAIQAAADLVNAQADRLQAASDADPATVA
jgi:cell division protein ZapA (FtsZ GTPase activity inhibitor)